jgi:peptide/nickel transport system ATP-binding protein/oligopeptide transport system ATP-binding protein
MNSQVNDAANGSGAASLLSVRNLVVRYRDRTAPRHGITAVRGVSLEIEPGRIHALVGESGSGKTSLARAALRLLPAESGELLFHGQDLLRMNARQLRQARRSIQAVFQDPQASLSPRRSVLQSLREPLDHFGLGRSAERADRAMAALEAVGLDTSLQHRYPHELSGGQRQRVALARALVSDPDLIIADEPLSSLDVSVQAHIIDLIGELKATRGLAFLFVSHDLSVVRRLADTVSVMYLGQILESATAAALFAHPAHPYTRALLASVPIPDPDHPPPIALGGEPPSALTPPPGCVFHMRCPERFEPCASRAPSETFPHGRDSNHRVRCHLWNT